MKNVALLVPETWLPLLEKAKGEQNRNAWLRAVIRDHLIDTGVWPQEKEKQKQEPWKVKIYLQTDIDRPIDEWGWVPYFKRAIRAVLTEFGYKVERIVWRRSPPGPDREKGRGLHFWTHIIGPPLTQEKKNLFHALIYDDWGRVWINRIRIMHRSNPNWSKIFSEVSYRKPIDEKCEHCTLRRLLMRLEKEIG